MDWFSVDKVGLSKLLEKKGKAFALFELIQNSWDTRATLVNVVLEPVAGRPLCVVQVEDNDPEGFKTLAHAWTLFAESEKRSDPSKRGRFNLGEKLVLALCEKATITSTRGTVLFDAEGRRETRTKRITGSVFQGVMRMTRAEVDEVLEAVHRMIPPAACETIVNGKILLPRPILKSVVATLPTEISDEEGNLRRTARQCQVDIHAVLEGETPTLYEMGIPVVELIGGERWHVVIGQKIPLSMDRENVTPGFLQTVRVHLADAMRDLLRGDDAKEPWLAAATADERIEPATVAKVLDARFGKKRAVFDPSDPEANKQLMNEGYTIVPGGALSAGQWSNVREHGLALPAGQVRPSGVQYDPNGKREERVIDPSKYTDGQHAVVVFAERVAYRLLGKEVPVRIVSEITMPHAAWYGGSSGLTFNVGRLGKAWFDTLGPAQLELLLHELAHDKVSDHLTREFADESTRLAVKLLDMIVESPEWLLRLGYRTSL